MLRSIVGLVALVAALALVAAGGAEDGGPPEPLFSCGVNKQLEAQEDYFGTSAWECVNGGSGSNTIYGNGGRDRLDGRDGTDPLRGGDGQDVLYGGREGDDIDGDSDDDYLYAGCPGGCDQTGNVPHFNKLEGNSGDDVLAARNDRTDDVLYGGGGYDVCYIDRGDETHGCEERRVG